jgi:hypothetical protein
MDVDYIYSVLERIESRQVQHNAILERLTVTVEQHERRSTNLENEFVTCRNECDSRITAANNLASSVEKTVDKFSTIIKWSWFLLVVIAGSIGFTVSIFELLDKIK